MFDKLKSKIENAIDSKHPHEIQISILDASKVSKKDIYRYRYNYGVNLGSLFVLENWIYDDLFGHGGGSELDAVTSEMKATSASDAGRKLAQHYESYISSIDWAFLQNAGVTAVRVPIGYWHVGNGKFVDGLPHESVKHVYQSAKPWDFLKQLTATAGGHDIGVLVDLHGLPGGANADSHSGCTISTASFFHNSGYINQVVNEILPFIAKDICVNNENVIGLQIVNESVFDNKASGQKSYYLKAVKAIQNVDSTLPVVISDGWWPQQWADWVQKHGLATTVVVDSHVYRCFSDGDKAKSAQEITGELSKTLNFPKDQADYMVGEFSCVLDSKTWDMTHGDRQKLVQTFGNTEISVFAENTSWGWFFWTLQFEHGDGGEWGFVPMVNNSAIPKRPSGAHSIIGDNEIKMFVQQHADYWKDKGGDHMEHWRYEDGLRSSVADMSAFANFKNSLVGRWYSWKTQRRQQYVKQKGDGEFMWEWEQGYQKGLDESNHY
ncbi:related to Putative glucan 1,3-beta-glucosidase [Zygosaccharomyces bailii ISA1307]|nr:related to Putative glucan 1,3-beta-glucosidase [Zygosaccharomyces bailii ISA1307]